MIVQFEASHWSELCHLEGEIGDQIHLVPFATGFNTRFLSRESVKTWAALSRTLSGSAGGALGFR